MSSTLDLELCIQRIRHVLNVDDDFGQECRCAEDLCRLLADGETLCCILCVLSDGCISAEDDGTISFYSENSQVLARRNVRFFLEMCTKHFGLPGRDLFAPEDLLEMRRPERVVNGLQTLFAKTATTPAAATAVTAGEVHNVINELCQAEGRLADKLDALLRFRCELLGLLSEWSEDLVESTFRYVEDLMTVHRNFHGRLSGLAEAGDPAGFCAGLADQFRATVPELAVYAKYFLHFPLAKARLDEEFRASPQLWLQLQRLESHFKVKSFAALYDSPFRQVFNYSLMFDRLLKTAHRELPETAASVEEALLECKRLLSQFNECRRSSEKAAATRQLLQSVRDLPAELSQLELVGLHRADGLFRVRRGQEPEQNCFCLLTDRQVIVAKASKVRESGQKFRFNVPIAEGLELDSTTLGSGVTGARIFSMQHPSVGTVVFARAPDGKKSLDICTWGQLVAKAQAFNFPTGWNRFRHRFQLQTFPAGATCTMCGEAMTRYVLQGYDCAHCGMRLDHSCLAQTVNLPSRPNSDPPVNSCRFLHQNLDRRTAERLLKCHRPGAFLLRHKADTDDLVLSMKWENDLMFHMILQSREGSKLGSAQYSIDSGCVWHASLDRLIAYYQFNMLSVRNVPGVTLGDGVPVRPVTMTPDRTTADTT